MARKSHTTQNNLAQPQWAAILAVRETPVKIKSIKICELQRECSSETGSAEICTSYDAKLHKKATGVALRRQSPQPTRGAEVQIGRPGRRPHFGLSPDVICPLAPPPLASYYARRLLFSGAISAPARPLHPGHYGGASRRQPARHSAGTAGQREPERLLCAYAAKPGGAHAG